MDNKEYGTVASYFTHSFKVFQGTSNKKYDEKYLLTNFHYENETKTKSNITFENEDYDTLFTNK